MLTGFQQKFIWQFQDYQIISMKIAEKITYEIPIENHFHQQNKLLRVNLNSNRLVIVAKGSLKLPDLVLLIKQKTLSFSSLGSCHFWWIANSVLNTSKLWYLLYIIIMRCCLLYLIKQNWLLKTFQRTLILKTQVTLYLLSLLELIWNCILFL